MYSFISVVIVSTLPPSVVITEVVELHRRTARYSSASVHCASSLNLNPSLTFSELVPLKVDGPRNTSITVRVFVLGGII